MLFSLDERSVPCAQALMAPWRNNALKPSLGEKAPNWTLGGKTPNIPLGGKTPDPHGKHRQNRTNSLAARQLHPRAEARARLNPRKPGVQNRSAPTDGFRH